jgi:hypothetical protein
MTDSKLNLNHLKKYLRDCTQEELISDILELIKRFPQVKDYYQLKLNPQGESEIAKKYKKIIEDEFFPARGFGKARLSVAKKAISEYKKVCITEIGMIDMMLFHVEQGVKYTRAYGDIDESFYYSIEGTYEKALSEIMKTGLEETFEERCRRIVEDTSEIGWGFHDNLSDMYKEAFKE